MSLPDVSKIVRLDVDGIKGVNRVTINALEVGSDGAVVIGGKNGQGKTSILDSIEYALGGKPDVKSPVKNGATSGRILLELPDLIIERKFSTGGDSKLEVRSHEGAIYKTPQQMLDRIYGTLTLDPLAFSRMDAKKQGAILRELLKLDFTEIDAKRAELFQERTDVNREEKRLFSAAQSMPRHPGAPTEPVDTAALMAEFQAASASNSTIDGYTTQLRHHEDDLRRVDEMIVDLEARLTSAKEQRGTIAARIEDLNGKLSFAERVDVADIQRRLSEADTVNRQVRENVAYNTAVGEWESAKAQSEQLTTSIKAIDEQKATMLAEAKFPVIGLAFDDGGYVVYNGVPFEQCSAAEQLRVSAAMAIAMNRHLRIMLIRDGSLLDDDSMRMLTDMCREADTQLWIERVGEGEGVSIVIEDGYIKGAPREVQRTIAQEIDLDGEPAVLIGKAA